MVNFEVIQQTIQDQIIINCINVQKQGREIVLKGQEYVVMLRVLQAITHKKVLIL